MFERRLKIFFWILAAFSVLLLLRAAQLQIVSGDVFFAEAQKSQIRSRPLQTTRGSILDFQGRPLAEDEPCLTAAVLFQAIEREPNWIDEQCKKRLGVAYRRASGEQRKALMKEETARFHRDLESMWATLARIGGKTAEEMDEIRSSIEHRVDVLRRYVWYNRWRKANEETRTSNEQDPWFIEWLLNGGSRPELDGFKTDIEDETDSHVILDHIDTDTYNWLKKNEERLPGLVLERGKRRIYPMGEVACHIIGRLSVVSAEDIKSYAMINLNPRDPYEGYAYRDLIGRSGAEALCELALRGRRGRFERIPGQSEAEATVTPSTPGKDIRLTIDAVLQKQIETAFRGLRLPDPKTNEFEPPREMHGAAVVIDVPTSQVRALVSYPVFDLNTFDERYAALVDDRENEPLLNRATQMAVQPGSTVKPIVGLGAITDGRISPHEAIDCTGYLLVGNRRMPSGRCWTVALAHAKGMGDAGASHARIPGGDPHSTGKLTVGDAIQRSCNVYFETVFLRMGTARLAYWYDRFGLGRRTGIGIAEWSGHIPIFDSYQANYLAAIGQSQVDATPLQMANVAATIARNGIWMRPRILVDEQDRTPLPSTRPAADRPPDRVDLQLDPAGLAAIRDGMKRAVNTYAGTGHSLLRYGRIGGTIVIAGKTGTATCEALKLPERKDGILQYDERLDPKTGKTIKRLKKCEVPIGKVPWYRQKDHAWFIGFAPADDPQIAFAVLLEYGGGGGSDAGVLANIVLEACMQHGYLRSDAPAGN